MTKGLPCDPPILKERERLRRAARLRLRGSTHHVANVPTAPEAGGALVRQPLNLSTSSAGNGVSLPAVETPKSKTQGPLPSLGPQEQSAAPEQSRPSSLETRLVGELRSLIKSSEKEFEEVLSMERKKHEQELESLRTSHKEIFEEVLSMERKKHEQELESLRTSHEEEMRQMREPYERTIDDLVQILRDRGYTNFL
ncbi:hypothetical protein F4778DRAFT_755360 [Xylariomycetidae sp. FL2044]|nr:hypothetical protein F4778DRAFT_755360 [Xylariomycetidae sp. FL2044]